MTDNGMVCESELLEDTITRNKREVDITIRAAVGGHEILIGIECRDHRRKATVEWVEQMVMKHQSLPTSKLVLVTTSGFSKEALCKAKVHGIDTYSFEEALETDWNEVVGDITELDIWSFRTVGCELVLSGCPDRVFPADPGIHIFDESGEFLGTLREIVETRTEQSADFTEKAIQFANYSTESFIGAELRIIPPLFAESKDGNKHNIQIIRVHLEVRAPNAATKFSAASYRDSQVLYGEGESYPGKHQITFIRSNSQGLVGAMSIIENENKETWDYDVDFPESEGKLLFIARKPK